MNRPDDAGDNTHRWRNCLRLHQHGDPSVAFAGSGYLGKEIKQAALPPKRNLAFRSALFRLALALPFSVGPAARIIDL
jgi:hypothetical protein